MALTTVDAVNQFKRRLLLTDSQWEAIESRRKATAGYAKQAFPSTSSMPVNTTKLIGSAGRETIIRPLDDIDLLVQFTNKNDIFDTYRHDSRAFLYRVRDALNEYARVQIVGARGQAVRFFYKAAPHVDIAPVFRWNSGGYALPDGDGGWLTTDPDFHAEHLKQKVNLLGSNLKPLIRMMKQWNRVHSHYLKSFHLEVMVTNAFSNLGSDSRAAAETFFDWARYNISVQDPAGHGGDLSTYLTSTQRSNVSTNLSNARDRAIIANRAEVDGDHEEAIRQWRMVFGSEFPSYG